MPTRPLLLALLALCLGTAGVGAQSVRPDARFARQDSTRRSIPAPLVGLMSAAVPGAGEFTLHLDRWLPQIALEALGWWQYRTQRAHGRAFEKKYRALACQAARGLPPGECRDTSYFEYYELMGKSDWSSSGRYDTDPSTPGVQPEQDEGTFNGLVWSRATVLNLHDHVVDTAKALLYYQHNAFPDAYYWNWDNSSLQQTVYSEYIRRGDDAFRTSSRILGFILVNHVTSAVDAFIVARLRELSRQPLIQVRSGLEPEGSSVRWKAGVALPAPR